MQNVRPTAFGPIPFLCNAVYDRYISRVEELKREKKGGENKEVEEEEEEDKGKEKKEEEEEEDQGKEKEEEESKDDKGKEKEGEGKEEKQAKGEMKNVFGNRFFSSSFLFLGVFPLLFFSFFGRGFGCKKLIWYFLDLMFFFSNQVMFN